MTWTLSTDLSDFTAQARPLLQSDPVIHNLPLTIIADLEDGCGFSQLDPLYLLRHSNHGIDGVALMTPPHPLLLAVAPDPAGLAACLAQSAVTPVGVNGPPEQARELVRQWAALSEARIGPTVSQHLLVLSRLNAPDPPPAGSARLATAAEVAHFATWFGEFAAEAHGVVMDGQRMATRRIEQRALWCWCEADGELVSMAAYSPPVAGMSRIGPVYTPHDRRRQGYAAAVTAAATLAAQHRGARQVCLFTDAANPTSNAVYERLGYRRISGRLVIELNYPVTGRELISGHEHRS